MPRPSRPSERYRLPDDPAPATELPREPDEGVESAPRGRTLRGWVVGSAVVLFVVAIGGVTGGRSASDDSGAAAPVVDVAAEDAAVATLAVFGAEVAAVDDLRARSDIFAAPGPSSARQAVTARADAVEQALATARAQRLPEAARRYADHGEHDLLVEALRRNADFAADVDLLGSTHDTVYDGAGSIVLGEAVPRLEALRAGTLSVAEQPFVDWAVALLDEVAGADRRSDAASARSAVAELWERRMQSLAPGAVEPLRIYVGTLPTATLDGLEGHPVAAPALARLLGS